MTGSERYHVTFTKDVPSIRKTGIHVTFRSNWSKGSSGEHYGKGYIFCFDHPDDAARWAARMDWEFHQGMNTGKITVVVFEPGEEVWEVDGNDPMMHSMMRGRSLRSTGRVKPEQITGTWVLTRELVNRLIQT